MPRISATLPQDLVYILEGAVKVAEFSSKSEVVQEALKGAFEDENKRVAAANALFEEDKIGAVEAFKLADIEEDELRSEFANVLGFEDGDILSDEDSILETIRKEFDQNEADI